MDHKDLCEHTKIRLIAAAIGHQQCTRTAANLIPLPGTDRVIAIGTRGEVARLLAGSATRQPTGDLPPLPPLPLDLDNTNPRISMHVKAGDLVTQLHRWGREVYLAGQSQATRAVPEGYALVPLNWTPEMRRAWDLAPWNEDDDKEFANAYRAMIAAAPQAPTAQEVTQQAAPDMRDAYVGAREDLAIWKKRALEAEESCRRLTAVLNAENGPTFMGEPVVTQQAAKAETGGVQAKTWKDAPYKLDHVAEAWARGWNDARAEFAKPKSDLTTVDCSECAGTGAVEAGEACDECDGQAKLIVSRKDLADLAPTTSTVSAPEEVRARVWDAVAGALDGVYYCNRVWSAWGVGTMSEDDFTPASEDDDILDNVVNVVFEALRTTSGKGEAA